MQTSGKSCREKADVYLMFENESQFPPRHCERSEAIHLPTGTVAKWIASLPLAMTLMTLMGR